MGAELLVLDARGESAILFGALVDLGGLSFFSLRWARGLGLSVGLVLTGGIGWEGGGISGGLRSSLGLSALELLNWWAWTDLTGILDVRLCLGESLEEVELLELLKVRFWSSFSGMVNVVLRGRLGEGRDGGEGGESEGKVASTSDGGALVFFLGVFGGPGTGVEEALQDTSVMYMYMYML